MVHSGSLCQFVKSGNMTTLVFVSLWSWVLVNYILWTPISSNSPEFTPLDFLFVSHFLVINLKLLRLTVWSYHMTFLRKYSSSVTRLHMFKFHFFLCTGMEMWHPQLWQSANFVCWKIARFKHKLQNSYQMDLAMSLSCLHLIDFRLSQGAPECTIGLLSWG